jgi:hypothetical protein
MDSEEEFEELNGEDINSDNTKEDEDEEMEEADETPGWIVPDGYLSEEEMKMGRDDEDGVMEAPKKQLSDKISKPAHYETQVLKPRFLLQHELSEDML